jgi:hypothetical protein
VKRRELITLIGGALASPIGLLPLGYTDIPAKIMQEGVAKTGVCEPMQRNS